MLKRIGAIVLTIAMLLSMACTFSVASAADAMALEVVVRDEKTNINPGDEVTIDVYVANQSVALSMVTVLGKYDTSKWELQQSVISADLSSKANADFIFNPTNVDTNLEAYWLSGIDTLPGNKYKFFTLTFVAKEVTENPGSAFSFWFHGDGIFDSTGSVPAFSTSPASKTVMVEKIVPTISGANTVNQGEFVDVTIGVGQYYGNMLKGIAFTGEYKFEKFDAEVIAPAGVTSAFSVENGSFNASFLAETTISKDFSFTLRLTAKSNASGSGDIKVGFMAADMIGNNGLTLVYGNHYSAATAAKTIEIKQNAEAKINETYYSTISAALAAATSDQKVVLLKDCEVDSLVKIPTGVTLDLNGWYIDYLAEDMNILSSFGHIVDTASNVGGIKISNDPSDSFVILQTQNKHLPLYDSDNDCYRFFEYELVNAGCKEVVANQEVKFGYQLKFENKMAYQLLATEANTSGITLTVDITWTPAGGDGVIQTVFRAEVMADFAQSTFNKFEGIKEGTETMGALTLTIRGLDKLAADAKVTTAPTIESVTNVTTVGSENFYQKSVA